MDIASLGFAVDSKPLADAVTELDALAPAADNAESSSKKLAKTMNKLNGAVNNNVAAAARGTAANDKLAKSQDKLNAVARGSARNELRLAAEGGLKIIDAEIKRIGNLSQGFGRLTKKQGEHLKSLRLVRRLYGDGAKDFESISGEIGFLKSKYEGLSSKLVETVKVQNAVSGSAGRLKSANDNLSKSAKGLKIGLGGIITFFAGIFLSALLQAVDTTDLLVLGLNKLADILPLVARYAALAGAGLLLVYSPLILKNALLLPGYILSAAKAMGLFASALAATVGLPVLIVAGLVAIVAAANAFRDELTAILGFDIVGAAKTGVNMIIGIFVGGFNAVRKVWAILPLVFGDLMLQTVNAVSDNIRIMVNQAISAVNLLNKISGKSVVIPLLPEGAGQIKNKFKGAAALAIGTVNEEFNNAIGTDFIGNAITGIDKVSKIAADKLRDFAKKVGADDSKKSSGETFSDIQNRAGQKISALTSEIKAVNLSSQAANTLRNETQLLNMAQQKGIVLTTQQRQEIKLLAGVMGILQEELKNQRGIKDLTTEFQKNETALMNEMKALKLTGSALSQFNAETELLAQIKSRDLTLTDQQTDALIEQARAVSALQDKVKALGAFKELNAGLNTSITALKAETQLIGMVGAGAEALRAETALLAAIKAKDVELTDAQTESLKRLAAEQAAITSANDNLKYFTDRNNSLRESAALVQAETMALGMNKEAASALLFETKLLNDEKFRGIQISADQRAELIANNNQLIASQSALEKMRDGLNFTRQTAGTFFSDLFSGLKNGSSAWDAFKNSVVNALDSIIQKMLDNAINSLVQSLFPSGGGGALGFLSGSFSNGAAFGSSGKTQFAKGGTFTNSVVSRPTLFSFARGGQLGEMGENGPEAIVPLKRGANGSLGVQMFGRGSSNDNAGDQTTTIAPTVNVYGIRDAKGVKRASATVAAEAAQTIKRAQRY